jgi:hypothetical protein
LRPWVQVPLARQFYNQKTPHKEGSFLYGSSYLAAPILNILVPQTGQVPVTAGRPFFIFIS